MSPQVQVVEGSLQAVAIGKAMLVVEITDWIRKLPVAYYKSSFLVD